ncbi:MAG: hypothetical protein U9Q89_00710 [Thermodesulfobacteriota bacterium]|nr:hypothetical protein [Thermodesulfobacteriota bacterium]
MSTEQILLCVYFCITIGVTWWACAHKKSHFLPDGSFDNKEFNKDMARGELVFAKVAVFFLGLWLIELFLVGIYMVLECIF